MGREWQCQSYGCRRTTDESVQSLPLWGPNPCAPLCSYLRGVNTLSQAIYGKPLHGQVAFQHNATDALRAVVGSCTGLSRMYRPEPPKPPPPPSEKVQGEVKKNNDPWVIMGAVATAIAAIVGLVALMHTWSQQPPTFLVQFLSDKTESPTAPPEQHGKSEFLHGQESVAEGQPKANSGHTPPAPPVLSIPRPAMSASQILSLKHPFRCPYCKELKEKTGEWIVQHQMPKCDNCKKQIDLRQMASGIRAEVNNARSRRNAN